MILNSAPYVGRSFDHGKVDCYDLLRSTYKDWFDITLTNYARPDNWWEAGQNLYMENFEAEGFEVVDVPLRRARPADVFLMAIRAPVANHCAIYLGDNKILHHPYGKLSEEHNLTTAYRSVICAHIRHPDVPNLNKARETVDIVSLLPPNKQKAYTDE